MERLAQSPARIDMLTVGDLQGSRKQRHRERAMRVVFQSAAVTTIVVSLLIVFVLARGAITFLGEIDWDLAKLVDSGWFPRRGLFDVRTIVIGSVVMGAVSMLVAVPFGLGTAIYLSEYARPRSPTGRQTDHRGARRHPLGDRGLLRAPVRRSRGRQPDLQSVERAQHARRRGLGVGVLVIPIMASISEDALRAVPDSLREASYGVGARKFATVTRVVLPAAVSGLVAAFIIAVSRAIGETMVATMVGGFDGAGRSRVDVRRTPVSR